MIHITGDWFIDGDAYNVILKKKRIQKKGRYAGEEVMDEVCYPRDFRDAIHTLIEKKVKLSLKEKGSMKEIASAVEKIHEDMNEFCDRYESRIGKDLKGN